MLKVENIWKEYDQKPLLRGVSFSVAPGEVVCLLGPSGSGKSTLLHIIAGLESFEKGAVSWNGEDLRNKAVHERRFSLMFQDYALFPHRSVAENIAFGLRMHGLDRDSIDKRVQQLLAQMNLASFGNRRVTDLSGGEMQRVALARALAPDPELLMLDEPLGSLDRTLSEHLAAELRSLLSQTGLPTIYVTHAQQEAFTIAARILLMHNGRIVQEGAPREVYQFPKSRWAAEFLGQQNLLEGTVIAANPLKVQTDCGEFLASSAGSVLQTDEQVTVLFRQTGSAQASGQSHSNHLRAVVVDSIFFGEGYQTQVRLPNDARFKFYLPAPYQPGASIDLYLPVRGVYCFQDKPETQD